MDFLAAALVAGGAGMALVVMQALNAGLGAQLASPLWAGLVNCVVSTATIGLVLIVFREPWPMAASAKSGPAVLVGRGVWSALRARFDLSVSAAWCRYAYSATNCRTDDRFPWLILSDCSE